MASNTQRLKQLIACYGLECQLCGKKLKAGYRGAPLPHYAATVEHRYPVGDIRRYCISERRNTTLACHECNRRTNDIWQARLLAIQHETKGRVNLLALAKAAGCKTITLEIYHLLY